jgi:hypothetical protein
MILLAFDLGKTEVDVEVAEAVTSLMEWQLAIRRELRPVIGDTPGARCANAILRSLKSKGEMTENLLCHNLNNYEPKMIHEALQGLVTTKQVQSRKTPRTTYYSLAEADGS